MSEDPTKVNMWSDPLTMRLSGWTNHGNHRIDVPFISHIGGNLYQGGCETGMVLPAFIKHIVSLYLWERYQGTDGIDSFVEVKMYDSTDQEFDQIEGIAEWVRDCTKLGPTLVHCQAGLNRSGLVAARVLMMEGFTGSEAVEWLRATRSPACLCNPSFEKWILEHA